MHALHQMNSTHTHPKLSQGNNPLPFAPEGGRLLALACCPSFLHFKRRPRVNPKGQSRGGHLMIPIDETTTRGGHMLAMTHPQDGMIKPTQ